MRRKRGIRTRRLLGAIGGCALALTFAGPAFGNPATLVVNTADDVVPAVAPPGVKGSPNPNQLSGVLDEYSVDIAACLTGDGAGSQQSLLETVGGTLKGVQDQVNGYLAGSSTLPDPVFSTNPAPVSASAADKCSLRMALHVAPVLREAIGNGGSGRDNTSVLIAFDKSLDATTGDKPTIKVTGVENQGAAEQVLPLPPIVDPLGTSGQKGDIEIDGCAKIASSRTTPCVNVSLPRLLGPVSSLTDLPSLAPDDVPGLLVAAPHVRISGIAFQSGGPAIAKVPAPAAASDDPTELVVRNCYFGREADGSDGTPPSVGIQLIGDNSRIGGTGPGDRNVFAGTDAGVLVSGGSNDRIIGNKFSGATSGVRVAGAVVDANRLDDLALQTAELETLGANPVADGTVPVKPLYETAQKNAITDNDFTANETAIDLGGPPLSAYGSLALETGDPPGVVDTTVLRNTLSGNGGEFAEPAIRVGNDAGETRIGSVLGDGNHFNANSGVGVAVEPAAGRDTTFERNDGVGNRQLLFDLNDDGIGNPSDGPNAGIQSPEITQATTAVVRGTAAPRSTVLVYLVRGTAAGNESSLHRGDIATFLARATAGADGSWSASVGGISAGQKVTAAQTVFGTGTSELARNATVVQAQTQTIDQGGSGGGTPSGGQPPAPQQKPQDNTPPAVTSVFGKTAPDGAVLKVATPAALSGEASDPSGIARIDVALQRTSAGASVKRRVKRCAFVDFRRARYAKRPCDQPLFAQARGTANWQLPLNAKVRRLLRRGRSFLLYVKATDRHGNVATRTLAVRFR